MENTVNWSLPWSSGTLIICTEQTNICINIFSATLTSQMAKHHKMNYKTGGQEMGRRRGEKVFQEDGINMSYTHIA